MQNLKPAVVELTVLKSKTALESLGKGAGDGAGGAVVFVQRGRDFLCDEAERDGRVFGVGAGFGRDGAEVCRMQRSAWQKEDGTQERLEHGERLGWE